MLEYVPSIGADPEAFVFDTETEKLVHAGGLIPGTKEAPHKVKHGAIQVDGVAVEFNIDPVQSEEEFVHNIQTVKQELTKYLKDVNKNLELRFWDTAGFDPTTFKNIPKEDLVVGCDPDFVLDYAYKSFVPAQIPSFPTRTRYAGGHLHVGNIFHKKETAVVKQMKQASLCSVLVRSGVIINNYEWGKNDDLKFFQSSNIKATIPRTCHYGKKGRCRPKDYGLEYRTPNNGWVDSVENQKKAFKEIFTLSCIWQEHFNAVEIERDGWKNFHPFVKPYSSFLNCGQRF